MPGRVFEKIERFLKLRELYLIVLLAAATYGAWATNILSSHYCLPLWQLLLLAACPLAVYLTARLFYLKKKRRFNRGDAVSVIGESNKYIVIDYMVWRPCHAICKVMDEPRAYGVNEKYLIPYKEPLTYQAMVAWRHDVPKGPGVKHVTIKQL
ncbi:MAG: hypothetical protein HC896_00165 [Bacteroidales bacterium]|nr:hypothetical protein [Bacteroidales bacterium]